MENLQKHCSVLNRIQASKCSSSQLSNVAITKSHQSVDIHISLTEKILPSLDLFFNLDFLEYIVKLALVHYNYVKEIALWLERTLLFYYIRKRMESQSRKKVAF